MLYTDVLTAAGDLLAEPLVLAVIGAGAVIGAFFGLVKGFKRLVR